MGKHILARSVPPVGLRLAVSLLALLAPVLLIAYEWNIEFVDSPHQFVGMSDRSLAVDANGVVHAAYGEDHLYHGWYDGAAWQCEVADGAPGVGEDASLCLDDQGYPHISYYDKPNGSLRYAQRDASGWHVEIVDDSLDVGKRTCIDLDAFGYPRIAYCEGHMVQEYYGPYWTADALKYAWRDSTGWHIEAVDTAGFFPSFRNSLAVGTDGTAHLSYYGGGGTAYPRLNYACRDEFAWYVEGIGGDGGDGKYSSLAVDSTGLPHIAYVEASGDLVYMRRDLWGWWHTEAIATGGDCSGDVSLVLADGLSPRIAYGISGSGLGYAYRDSLGWHTDTADSPGASGRSTSLALDEAGHAHVMYCPSYRSTLRYVHKDGSGWHAETIDQERWAGLNTSLALDAEDRPNISYHASTNRWYPGDGYLKRAWRDAFGWHTEAVDSGGSDAGRYSSIAAGNDGSLHIAYCTGLDVYQWWCPVDLKHGHHDAFGWHIETVDTMLAPPWDGVGDNNSIAVDSEGNPHISYHATSSYRYATRNAAVWDVETISGGAPSYLAACTSVALDGAGFPHICFRESDTLKYSHKDAGGWETSTVDSTWGWYMGTPGTHASLALDESDRPHISYYDAYYEGSMPALRYARMTEPGWLTETVDSIGNVGQYCSLALDGLGYPHVSYYDETNRALKYAYQGPCGWTIQTVDGNGFVGKYSSIAVPRRGEVHISYYDEGGDDLKYARGRMLVPADDPRSSVAGTLRVLSLAPNPVTTGEAIIRYSLPGSVDERLVSLKIYDPLGRLVAVPFVGTLPAGTHSLEWDLSEPGRARLSPGVYTLRLESTDPAAHDAKRLVLVR
jgi:hypothetical protein